MQDICDAVSVDHELNETAHAEASEWEPSYSAETKKEAPKGLHAFSRPQTNQAIVAP